MSCRADGQWGDGRWHRCRFYVGTALCSAPVNVPARTDVCAIGFGTLEVDARGGQDGATVTVQIPPGQKLFFEDDVTITRVSVVPPIRRVRATRIAALRAVGTRLLVAWADERALRLDADKRFGEVELALKGVPANPAWCEAAQVVAQFIAGERFVGEVTIGVDSPREDA